MADARVQSAISHWAPRFVQAGMDYSDFMRVSARWSAGRTGSTRSRRSVTGMRSAPRRRSSRACASPPARRGCTPPSPITSRSSSGWSTRRRARAVADRAVAAIYAAHHHLDPSAERIEAPLDGGRIVGNLRVPWYDERPPLVLLIPGLDSTKEEFWRLENVFLGARDGGAVARRARARARAATRCRSGTTTRPRRRRSSTRWTGASTASARSASASAATTRRARRRSRRGSRPWPGSAARSTSARCGSRCRN